jgi:hypothetical protein
MMMVTGNLISSRAVFSFARHTRRDDRRAHLTDRRPFRTHRVASIDARA